MIRLALIAHLSEVSGAGMSLLQTCRCIDKSKFASIFVVPSEGPLSERARQTGLHVAIVSNDEQSLVETGFPDKARLTAGRLDYIRRMRAFLREEKIQLAYVNSSASIFAGLAARMAGIPIVWHVHETIIEPDFATKVKMRFIERLADSILYASSSAQRNFPAARVQRRLIVKNRVDVEAWANAEIRWEWPDLGVAREDTVITANGLFWRKGPDVFLRAACLLASRRKGDRLKFILLGPLPFGGEKLKEELVSIAENGGILGQVIFAGLRGDNPEILKRSSIFVSASRNEALPIMLIEAMAAGTPVIATRTGDCAQVLDEGCLGVLISPEDPESLASAMEEILSNPKSATPRAILANSIVTKDYGAADFWRPLEQLLLETAALSKT